MPAIPPYIHRSTFGNNSVLCSPSERCIILWAVTARASPTGWFSTSWFRFWFSAAPIGGSPTIHVRPPRFGTAETSG